MELDKLETEEYIFVATDTFLPRTKWSRQDKYTAILDQAIPDKISLKIGAQVMLKANLDISSGLANGSRGVIVDITEENIDVKWLNGRTTHVTFYTWESEDKEGCASRTQIPLILAYSITIHGCQGCTLDYVICDLGGSIFSNGQAYVALSRVRSSEGLFLKDFIPQRIMVDADALEFIDSMTTNESINTSVNTTAGTMAISTVIKMIKPQPILKKTPKVIKYSAPKKIANSSPLLIESSKTVTFKIEEIDE
jgi:hypothetical protein